MCMCIIAALHADLFVLTRDRVAQELLLLLSSHHEPATGSVNAKMTEKASTAVS